MATPCGRIFEHAAADSVSTVRPQQGNRLVVISGVLEPFATLALCCACLGLRISEALGLQWHDVDWLRSQIAIRRSIVQQHVDECKTEGSAKSIVVASELLDRLKAWKQVTQFSSDGDWVFASSVKLGRLPFSYRGVAQTIDCAANAAGIRKISTHAFRHSFRSWLGAEGVPVAIQKELMRHSTIGMTLRYGTTFDAQLRMPARESRTCCSLTERKQSASPGK